jgi:hypothetical protein
MDYTLEIKNGVDNKVIKPEDIFDFRGSQFEQLLFDYYKFCRENLNIHSANVDITPNILLFTNSFEINAGAGISNKHFVITINLGLFKFCVENYYNNEDLTKYFQALYPETIMKFDNPVNILAFQICTQFTYYHELAHLFQFSTKKDDLQIQERNDLDTQVGFDKVKHILEINADTYASISVATHIEQYIDRTFKDNVTTNNTIETLVFFCCCLLNYTLSFSKKTEDIYFDKNTHPHSFIRLLTSILNITNHLEQSPYFKQKGIVLNGGNLFSTVVEVYKDLESNNIFGTNVSEIIDTKKDLSKPIVNYIYSLIQFDLEEYTNAMDIWNKHIT